MNQDNDFDALFLKPEMALTNELGSLRSYLAFLLQLKK